MTVSYTHLDVYKRQIIQDIGALSLLGNCFPGLELHASTQMTVTDVRGAVFLSLIHI